VFFISFKLFTNLPKIGNYRIFINPIPYKKQQNFQPGIYKPLKWQVKRIMGGQVWGTGNKRPQAKTNELCINTQQVRKSPEIPEK